MRKAALTAHVTVSIGWIGALAAYLALDVIAATGADVLTLRAAYTGMDRIAGSVIVPLALASLVTGVVMAVGTKWGLVRHYWVLISLLLTTVATGVLLAETRTIARLAETAADPTTSGADLHGLGSTLVHSVGGLAVLLVVLVLNMYKPSGLTRHGWRKQREESATGGPPG